MKRVPQTLTSLIAMLLVICGVLGVLIISGEMSAQGSGGLWLFPSPTRQALENAARAERLQIETQAEAEAARIRAETARVLQPIGIIARVGFVAILLFGVGGLVYVGIVWASRKAHEIRPNDAGIFPAIVLKVMGVQIVHDPNRAATATTCYAPSELAQTVTVIPVQSEATPAQLQAALAGAFVQVTAARNRHAPVVLPGRGNRPVLESRIPDVEQPEPGCSYLWPSRVPLTGLLAGNPPSLAQLVLGVSVNEENGQANIITGNMAQLVHVAVGGTSGWGKSKFLQMLAYQIATSGEADLCLIDLERVTFALFSKCGALRYPVADNEQDALAILGALSQELDKRKALFADYPGVELLTDYNAETGKPIRPIVTLIDESTALLADKGIESALKTLSMRARKYGLWLVLGGQDWRASSLDTAIRNQFSARVQFKALSSAQSRVLLERSGAETLDVPGRALMVLPGRDMLKVQTPFVSRSEIETTLAGDGPRFSMPQPIRTAQADEQAERIRRLAAEGKSKRQIQLEVFGYAGGAAYTAVSKALGGTTTA